MKRNILIFFGIVFIILGISLLICSCSITGNVISNNLGKTTGSLLGLVFLIGGMGLFVASVGRIENIVIGSKVKSDPLILRVAENIGKKGGAISHDINHLVKELNKGNTNPGVGTRTIFRGVRELRGRHGGRVYFQEVDDGKYEILGYSDKDSQSQVIGRIKDLYA